MDFSTFYQNFIRSYDDDDKGLRLGQYFINEVSRHNLELFNKMPKDLDCYYNDRLFCDCSNWVQENWENCK